MSQQAVLHGRDFYTAHAEQLFCWCHMWHFCFSDCTFSHNFWKVRGSNPQQGQGGLVPAACFVPITSGHELSRTWKAALHLQAVNKFRHKSDQRESPCSLLMPCSPRKRQGAPS